MKVKTQIRFIEVTLLLLREFEQVDSPQGVLRLNGRKLLFGEAKNTLIRYRSDSPVSEVSHMASVTSTLSLGMAGEKSRLHSLSVACALVGTNFSANCRTEYPKIGAIPEAHGVDGDPPNSEVWASNRPS